MSAQPAAASPEHVQSTGAPPRGTADEAAALHALILHQLDEDQAAELVTIPLEGKSSIADHMVIASGRSSRHVAAMAEKIAERVKRETGRPVRIEGLPTADWVLIDGGDVIVHLFRPEVRNFYNLERIWGAGEAPPVRTSEPMAELSDDPFPPRAAH